MILKLVFFILGIVAISFGVLYLFAPEVLIKLSELTNKVIFNDRKTFVYRRITGAILIIAGALFLLFIFK